MAPPRGDESRRVRRRFITNRVTDPAGLSSGGSRSRPVDGRYETKGTTDHEAAEANAATLRRAAGNPGGARHLRGAVARPTAPDGELCAGRYLGERLRERPLPDAQRPFADDGRLA